MNLRQAQIGFVALALAGSTLTGAAEPPVRERGTAIIFSAPKSDTVSSNLNELRTPATPFRKLEEGLKKPFEAFDSGMTGPDYRPVPRRFNPPAAPSKKSLKEVLNERAEEMFLSPDSADKEDNDLFKAAEDNFDPYRKKPKTTLDRYYDRLDQTRAALTNRPASPDRFGEKTGTADTDLFRADPKTAAALTDAGRVPPAQALRNLSERNPGGENLFPDRTELRSFNKELETKPAGDDRSGNREPKETRLDTFRRLLEVPSQTRGSSFSPSDPYAVTPTRPTPYLSPIIPSTSGFGGKPANPTAPAGFNSFAKSAGLVGNPSTPQGLPDYTASPTAGNPGQPTPLPKTTPPASFNIPKRRF